MVPKFEEPNPYRFRDIDVRTSVFTPAFQESNQISPLQLGTLWRQHCGSGQHGRLKTRRSAHVVLDWKWRWWRGGNTNYLLLLGVKPYQLEPYTHFDGVDCEGEDREEKKTDYKWLILAVLLWLVVEFDLKKKW